MNPLNKIELLEQGIATDKSFITSVANNTHRHKYLYSNPTIKALEIENIKNRIQSKEKQLQAEVKNLINLLIQKLEVYETK